MSGQHCVLIDQYIDTEGNICICVNVGIINVQLDLNMRIYPIDEAIHE